MRLATWVQSQTGTVADCAKRIGIGRVALHRLMRGQTFPSLGTRRAIVTLTGGAVSYADLSEQFEEFHAGEKA